MQSSIYYLTRGLLAKVSAIDKSIFGDAYSLPERVKEIISLGFAEMGWNGRSKKVIDESKFNLQSLKDGLREMLLQLENWAPIISPDVSELDSLSSAANKLWELDSNRLVPNRDYVINVERSGNGNFFAFVDESKMIRPTFDRFTKLLDNYIAAVGQTEVVTREETDEDSTFLDMILDTAVMQYVQEYLFMKKKIQFNDRAHFKSILFDLWFGLYSRKARNDSSGFEHVFIGEIDPVKNEVIGMHNWIQIYSEEKKGNFKYLGLVKPKRRAATSVGDSNDVEQLLSFRFSWKDGASKSISTSLIGTSTEFEIALYTLCFYCGESNETAVQLGPYQAKIICYTWPPNPHPGESPLS